jgi:hypothetical protein
MQRNYQTAFSSFQNDQELTTQTAIHEAGHAASIYLGNKLKDLPPVFFQIKITQPSEVDNQSHYAKVIGGHLIQSLPIAELENDQQITKEQQLLYRCAYEADVINLLVGPLAEAKYISARDDEEFNINLLNTYALNYYGGYSDVKKANSYLEYFIPLLKEREEKMLTLFSQAFDFVENAENWWRIVNLAQYIIRSNQEIISCEEAIDAFESDIGLKV